MCPFNGNPCIKIVRENFFKPPVCSVRNYTRRASEKKLYITCEHRLISSQVHNITEYQKTMLLHVAKKLFHPSITRDQVAYRAEREINTGVTNNSKADFILAVTDENLQTLGPRRMIVEVQGGGETGNTGKITKGIIEPWAAAKNPTNDLLRTPTSKASPIPVNAWRRSQQQLIAKGKTAQVTGYGFAILFGEFVFDYLVANVLPELPLLQVPKDAEWNTAFVVFKEQHSPEIAYPPKSVPLMIDDSKTVFTTMDLFINAVQRREISPDNEAFSGKFTTLDGRIVHLD